eukprot:GHVN01020087.1.p1 GENE.GHVN01020087.1~~GHVN01020087.1.p1  ORF type:complete len:193 (+),score=15.96 GHVN01020087.1:145-723(+)
MDVGSPLRKMSPSAAVGAPLSLQKIRSDLIRQEETIIFAIIERTQYRCNDAIYRAGHFDVELDGLCLMSYFLRETERLHAKLRRYVSDEEHAFFADSLPCPVLPIKGQPDILKPNRINLNEKIFQFYVKKVVPRICPEGDDGEVRSFLALLVLNWLISMAALQTMTSWHCKHCRDEFTTGCLLPKQSSDRSR